MSEAIAPTKTPKVGFVSLGCPKALTDSERRFLQKASSRYRSGDRPRQE